MSIASVAKTSVLGGEPDVGHASKRRQLLTLNRHIPIGMNNGLTQSEIAEAITHLAFYVGWPNVLSAMPIAKDVFEKRPK